MKIKLNKKCIGMLLTGSLALINPHTTLATENNETIDLIDTTISSEISYEDDFIDLEIYKTPVIRATTTVNIRKEPNTECEILGLLEENETIRFMGLLDNWYEVLYNGSIAFVCADYVIGDYDIILPDDFKKLVYMNTDTELYSSNNYNNPITTLLTYECGEVYKETNGFYLVKTNEGVGFVPIENTSFLGDKAVVVDISSQKTYLYYDNKRQLTTDCVTGKPSSPTYLGLYYVYYKQKNTRLTGPGYDEPVEVWMPFNGNIGLHDAYWRYGVFGGNIYMIDGSHGCVNLPKEAAHKIYDNVESGTPVLVKK